MQAITEKPTRYDLVARTLHWLMALLFLWIFCSAAAHYALLDSAIDKYLWPTHKPVGLLLFILFVLRASWAVARFSNRPQSVSKFALSGHRLLYLFMFAIPFIGLLRQYGSGREFIAFGVPVFPGFAGDKVQWMIDMGSNFHGVLGWTLLLVIGGHIGAVVVHYCRGDKYIAQRMLGNHNAQ